MCGGVKAVVSDQQRRSAALIGGLRVFASADAERGREFARSRSMHFSDAAAVHDDAQTFFAPVAEALDAVLGRYTPQQLDAFTDMITNINDVIRTGQQ